MGCCGKNRAALSESTAQKIPPMQRIPANVRPTIARSKTLEITRQVTTAISVRYLERSSVVVRGAVTGRQYAFSGTSPVQAVDARDANAFLLSSFFHRA
jgi:hypothetical protein